MAEHQVVNLTVRPVRVHDSKIVCDTPDRLVAHEIGRQLSRGQQGPAPLTDRFPFFLKATDRHQLECLVFAHLHGVDADV